MRSRTRKAARLVLEALCEWDRALSCWLAHTLTSTIATAATLPSRRRAESTATFATDSAAITESARTGVVAEWPASFKRSRVLVANPTKFSAQ